MDTHRNVVEGGDDVVVDLTDVHFNNMALTPVACVNYMSEHTVKLDVWNVKPTPRPNSGSMFTLTNSAHKLMMMVKRRTNVRGRAIILTGTTSMLRFPSIHPSSSVQPVNRLRLPTALLWMQLLGPMTIGLTITFQWMTSITRYSSMLITKSSTPTTMMTNFIPTMMTTTGANSTHLFENSPLLKVNVRNSKMNSGIHNVSSITMMTIFRVGTCAGKYTNMPFGVTKIVDLSVISAWMNGQSQILFI